MKRQRPTTYWTDRLLDLKSLAKKAPRIPDPLRVFRRFERDIHPQTWARQREILDRIAPLDGTNQVTPDLARALELRSSVLEAFRNSFASRPSLPRILIHLPNFGISPAGHSLFRNLGAGLAWLGVPVDYWQAGTPIAPHLEKFQPSILLSIDLVWYAWNALPKNEDAGAAREYKKQRGLILGLSSNHALADPVELVSRFKRARELGVDFFYSFQCPEFVAARYIPYAAAGFPVAGVEFGANPLVYQPLPGIKRDLNYVLLASSNGEKYDRYADYFSRPLKQHPGLIIGPGWTRSDVVSVPDEQANRLYNRAKIGINLHVPFQIADATELNERTYNLAASATPQLVDGPALLASRFSADDVFAAETPDDYFRQFEYMLAHPEEAAARGIRSMERVLTGHTIFHRTTSLMNFIEQRFEVGRE